MANEGQIQQLEGFLNGILAEEPTLFLVSMRVVPTNNIKIFVDGDEGITIEKCVRINRKLYKLIEETGLYPDGDFSMEVSSPGADEPLKLTRQYNKHIGRSLEITFNDDSTKEGKLISLTEADILIEQTEGKGKKAVTQQVLVPFENIKTAVVQIKF